MEYVKINGAEYPAKISGKVTDSEWDDRQSKTIKFENNVMSYSQACALFTEGAIWSIITTWTDEDQVEHRDEFDNSDYNMAGSITNMRDGGTVLVKMGKPTEIESLLEDIYGGES